MLSIRAPKEEKKKREKLMQTINISIEEKCIAGDFWPQKDTAMFDLMSSGLVKLQKLYIEQKQRRAFTTM